MTREQALVKIFHRATGGTVGEYPEIRDAALRIALIREEAEEFAQACGYEMYDHSADYLNSPDLTAAADALGDLLYVVYGAGVAFGIDLGPVFDEIHKSNMSKVGGPKRADGKQLKPPDYRAPELAPILEAQRVAAEARSA